MIQQKKNIYFNCKAFTLLEVLIAMLIGFLVVGACYVIFLSQNQASIRNDERNELVGTINIGMNLLTRHIRMAGYGGIGWSKEIAISPINNFNAGSGNWFNPALFDGGGQFSDGNDDDIKQGTDAFLALYSDNFCPDGALVDSSNPADNGDTSAGFCQPNCFDTGTNTFQPGDVGVIIGTSAAGNAGVLVEITGVNNAVVTASCSGAGIITTVTYTSLDEWNLPIKYDCQSATPGQECFQQRFYRLEVAYLYYINTLDHLVRAPVGATFSTELIAEGVEDMQILYTIANNDCDTAYWGVACGATTSAPANPFQDGSDAGTDPDVDRLQEIRSLQLAMVFKSLKEDRTTYLDKGSTIDMTPYGFDHNPPATTDSFRRSLATQTIRVKNLELLDF